MKKTKLLLKSLVATLVAAGLLVSASVSVAQGTARQRADQQEEVMNLQTQTADQTQSPVGSKDMLLNEGFTTWPPAGWSFITATGAAGWAQFTEGTNQVARHDYSVANNADWMITPAIALPATPQLLIFKDKGQYQTYYDLHAVAISTSPTMSSPVIVYEGAGASTYTTNYVDLTAWAGQTIYVGFFYQGYDADRWYIDDVQVDLRANYGYNDILTFEFAENVEAGPAVIDANAGTVNINVFKMYENNINALTPVFTISQGAVVSPTVTGVQNFTSPFNIHVYAINGDHQLWTVNVGVAPGRTGTEVMAMNVANEVGTEIVDAYAKRISAKVLYDSTLVLAPSFTLSAGANIAPVTAQDFGTGFKFYTVTAEDGTTTAQWRVGITNAPANNDASILGFAHANLVNYKKVGDNYYGYLTVGTDLTAIQPVFTLPLGATITPTAAQNFTTGPKVYTVTAQDGITVKQYTVMMYINDVVAPTVTLTADANVSNVSGSVIVTSTEKPGIVALVKSDVVVTNAASVTAATTALKAVWKALTTSYYDTLKTFGLTAGLYKAYAFDSTGNLSVPSSEITVFVDTAQVATIADLWKGKSTVIYKLTGEALLTMKQTYRNQKWVQDATAGIMIDDNSNVLATNYNIGDGITGLKGTILNYFNTMEFIPVAVGPAASSTGNAIEPIELSVADYMANHAKYQSRLIKLHNMIVNDIATGGNGMFQSGKNYPSWNYEGGYVYLRTNFYDADYIGTALPVDPINIVGLGAQYTSGTTVTRQIFPRSAADLQAITNPEYLADASVDFGGVNVNDSATYNFSVANVGTGELIINSVTFSGDAAFVATLGTYPDTLGAYDELLIPVKFKPTTVGNYNGMFIVNYGANQIDTVMVHGLGKIIPIVDIPYFNGFEQWEVEGWTMNGFTYFYNATYAHTGAFSAYMKYGAGSMLSPGFDLSGTQHPTLEMWQNGAYAVQGTRSISVSTDLNNWVVLFNQTNGTPDITLGQPYQKLSFDLTAYAGQTVYVRFLYNNASASNSYWFIDDFNFLDVQETPFLSVNADPIDFGYTLTTIPGVFGVSLTNTGASFIGVDNITITGPDAALFSIEGTPTVEEMYFGSSLDFNLTFAPTTGGVKNATMVIHYHDALVANKTKEVALTGSGLECSTSPLVTLGMNSVPFAPYWQRFVAPTSGIVTITSNIPGQEGLDFDTRLFVYADCNSQWAGTEGHDELAFSEDISTTNFTSTVSFLAFEGTTYYIFWHDKWYDGNHDFLITIDNTPGIICELAIPITLPLENNILTGTTEDAANFYGPEVVGVCNTDFIKGNDKVYTFTLTEPRVITGSIDGNYVAMHVINGILPLAGNTGTGTCFAYARQQGTTHFDFNNKLFPAGTYYIVVSTWAPPQFSEFTIHLTMAPTTADVTFNVNMGYQIAAGFFDPAIHQVKVGAMEFEPETLTDEDGDSIYSVTLTGLTIGETIHYAYAFAGEGTDTTFEDSTVIRMHTVVAGENIRNDLFNNWTTINEVELMSNLKVFPNPNNGRFSLTLNSGKAITIEVVNMKGQVVYTNRLNASGIYPIDLTSVAKGVYYLKVNNGHSVKVEKVVVE